MRATLFTILILLIAFVAFGLWTTMPATRTVPATAPMSGTIDTSAAHERGAELGEKAAVAAEKVRETAAEAAVTTKIKAKMALDDTVKARRIDVSTSGSTVTVRGTVGSQAERERALALARETNGVTHVIDELRIER